MSDGSPVSFDDDRDGDGPDEGCRPPRDAAGAPTGDAGPYGDGGVGPYGSSDDPGSLDEAAERRMRAYLEEGDHDADLGLAMAKDAQRVVAGDLSEAEFYERYHEDLLAEFGQDAREFEELREDLDGEVVADASDPEGVRERLGDLADGEDVSRRELMKKGGAAAAALGVFAGASAAQSEGGHGGGAPGDTPTEGDGTRWGMVINLNNCDGCLACMAACSQEHGLSRGANWMYVFTYEDENQDDESFLVRPCQHCTNSPCTKVCPVGARHTREEDGLVLTDYDICIGCRYCEVSCPYGVNYFQWGEPDVPDEEIPDENQVDDRGKWVGARPPQGVMGKCTFCVDRQDGAMGEELVGTTACEQACTMDAIHFGDLNDEESPPNQHLREYREDQANDLSEFEDRKEHTVSTFQLMEERGTNPNVHYIGNEPSQDAQQVEGPVTYEEVGLVDDRTEVLDNGAMANESEEGEA